MKTNSVNLTQVPHNLPIPLSHLAIVSPCSSCKNQLAENANGRPACPRRRAVQRKADLEARGLDTSSTDHLVLTGTDGNDLANPVYVDTEESGAILVWVATLKDNPGVRDGQGNLLTPHILNPSFDTQYINCRPLPVVPRDNEAAFFQKGAWAEGDTLEVTIISNQQLNDSPDSDSVDDFQPVLIDGFASKVNFVFRVPRKPVNKDLAPAGT